MLTYMGNCIGMLAVSMYGNDNPSIHPFSIPVLSLKGHGDLLEPIPAVYGRKAGVHPGQVASPSQGHTTFTLTFTHSLWAI